MKISISVSSSPSSMTWMMFSRGLERDLPFVAQCGYEGVDLFLPRPKEINASAVRKMLDQYGLKVTMLASQGDMMADGLFLNNPARLSELLERSRYHLGQCAELGTKPNLGFIRGRHNGNPDSLKHMAEGTAAYCELAKSMGVEVLLEPICRYDIDSIPTVHDALALWNMAGRPENLSFLLDLFHAHIEEKSICGAICEGQGHIGHVHFVDNTRGVPGTGCLNLGDIVSCLHHTGYDGFLGIEAIPGKDPEGDAVFGLAFAKALCRRHC